MSVNEYPQQVLDALERDGGILTAREQKMLALLVEGLTNAEIGRRLGTTRYTIQRLTTRLGNRRGWELALWWLQRTEGGLKPEPAFAPQNVVESRKESAA